MILTAFALILPLGPQTPAMKPIDLKANLTIMASTRVNPKVYRLANEFEDARQAAITIKGDDVTVDFQGATLEGTAPDAEPNERKGTGIFVAGRNVVLKNLKIRGYKIGLAAHRAAGLKLENIDASYNWKQRLLSNLDREDGADWMSFHQNEKDEWLRYGAAFYLRACDDFEIKNCRAVGGQCGLMLTDSNKGLVWNNDFSFLSAVGLGMYRSSDNRILHNKLDWCVRGFSYGKYNRGQDSTGILIYEQSHRNVFAYNSATHGGDGFFLWAGQTTMDTGQGGCNDNLLYGNDFSHSPANGIEATFSRNRFANNLLLECWHGIWGGYSYETDIVGNVFGHNQEAIAIEHGQDNTITHNVFNRDHDGLVIWANDRAPDPNWGYPKHRDTRSRDYRVAHNDFVELSGTAIRLTRTLGFSVEGNRFQHNGSVLTLGGENPGLSVKGNRITTRQKEAPLAPFEGTNEIAYVATDGPMKPATSLNPGNVTPEAYRSWFETDWNPYRNPTSLAVIGRALTPREQQIVACAPYYVPPMTGGINPFLKKDALRGWRYILVDQWGPYDFKSPVLWPRGEVKERLQVFEILGPKGTATVAGEVGAKVDAFSTDEGKTWTAGAGRAYRLPVPCLVRIAYDAKPNLERSVTLQYRGEAVTDYRGIVTPKGKPFLFGFRQYFLPIDWSVKFFKWDESNDPRTKPDAFQALIGGSPVKVERVDRINYAGDVPGVPGDHFATVADGTFEVPPGDYILSVTSDDGCRVWVDGTLVIKDAWKYQGPTLYTANLKLGGKHRIHVEHFEIDGYSALKVELTKNGRSSR